MPDLIMALAGLVVLGAVAAVVVHRREQRSREVEMEVGIPFSTLSLILAFESDSAILWETQLPALELISSAGGRGVPLWRLHPAYMESVHHYPELYEGSSFHEWLEYLSQAHLVARNGSRIALTPEGGNFLGYLRHWQSLPRCANERSAA